MCVWHEYYIYAPQNVYQSSHLFGHHHILLHGIKCFEKWWFIPLTMAFISKDTLSKKQGPCLGKHSIEFNIKQQNESQEHHLLLLKFRMFQLLYLYWISFTKAKISQKKFHLKRNESGPCQNKNQHCGFSRRTRSEEKYPQTRMWQKRATSWEHRATATANNKNRKTAFCE